MGQRETSSRRERAKDSAASLSKLKSGLAKTSLGLREINTLLDGDAVSQ